MLSRKRGVNDAGDATSTLRRVQQQLLGQRRLSAADVEMTVSILRRISRAARTINRKLVVDIVNRVLEQGRTWMTEMLPDTLDDVLQLLSDLPARIAGKQDRLHFVHQVAVVVESATLHVR